MSTHQAPLIEKIHRGIENEHFNEVLKNIDKMPAWMRKVFIQYKNMRPNDPALKDDLDSYYQG